jgi:lysophospholipase L1-like esterase
VGGALGIATLATLIQSGNPGGATTFEHVYVFCALAAAGAAVAGLGLTLRPVAAPRLTEADDPYLTVASEIAGTRWKRFAVIGDSMAEGIGDPVPGYRHLGWGDRVAQRLGAEYLNLGRRNLLAAEVRDTQLDRALAFGPDLAAVVCGGNDLMRHDHDPAAVERVLDGLVGALRAKGSDVIMFAPFDMSQTGLLPDEDKARWKSLIDRMSRLAVTVARRHGALVVDCRQHPAGADPSIYSRDRIHLNARGQAICAAETLRALERHAAEPEPVAA